MTAELFDARACVAHKLTKLSSGNSSVLSEADLDGTFFFNVTPVWMEVELSCSRKEPPHGISCS
jgi:hypothetical protein